LAITADTGLPTVALPLSAGRITMSFFGKRRTSENQAGQGVDLDQERTKLHEQRWRGVQLTDSL